MENNKKVCVTGATGFLASHLILQLLEKGYYVNGTVRDPNDKKNEYLTLIKNASTHLKLFKAELETPNDFDEAFKGCHAVFHVASPCFFVSNDPQKELLNPAINGTKNVLESVERTGVKVVVVTSTGATMGIQKIRIKGHILNEEDWSVEEFMRKFNLWYPLSKTIAERTFWEWSEKNKEVRAVSVAPCMVTGPPLQPKHCNGTIRVVDRSMKFIPNVGVPLIDVRDVALSHIIVYENENAKGRCFAAAESSNDTWMCETLRKHFPERSDKIPSKVDLKEGEKVSPPFLFSNSNHLV